MTEEFFENVILELQAIKTDLAVTRGIAIILKSHSIETDKKVDELLKTIEFYYKEFKNERM